MNIRYRIIYFIIAFFCLATFSRLIHLQIIKGDEYRKQSEQRLFRTTSVEAPRGDILDRNGKELVKNKTGYAVKMYQVNDMSDAQINKMLLTLTTWAREDGSLTTESFPLSDEEPYEILISGESETEWKEKYGIDKNADADKILEHFRKEYNVENYYTDKQARFIIGARYEMDVLGFSESVEYTLAQNASDDMITKVKEQSMDLPGVAITTSPMREYPEGSLAAHILGRVGRIYKEEYETLQEQGYSMNDIIGKQGIEKVCEDNLKGKNGLSRVEQSLDGKKVDVTAHQSSKKGNNVVLTIDAEIQKAAERALKEGIAYVRERSAEEEGEGYDASSGAVVALDINSGEILAIASYPSYNPSTFDEDYSSLSKDKRLPMFNRAIGGAYEPGSTFKMITSIAALEEKIITPYTSITDEGIYDYYSDYKPRCWIYSSGATHGPQNVTQALENSCNYFFYDVGRRTTITTLNKYATLFGLGSKTGIELENEESSGILAGPEQKAARGEEWMPGDTLQAAIGQSDNMFTPIQLANYVAMLANGGTRYKPHLIKEIRSSETGEIIKVIEPEILSRIELNKETRAAVMNGMKNVVEFGTASTVFDEFEVGVGGKTGTAEVSDGSDNAIFVGYAPSNAPTVAICVVIEHGVHGSNAAIVARDVFKACFNGEIEADDISIKNILTH